MKATGADIWDFYLNGWPTGYYHDNTEIEIGYVPDDFNLIEAAPIIDLEKEYDLNVFGLLVPEVNADYGNNISFEDAYLSWKCIEKPQPMTFDHWFEQTFYDPTGEGSYTKAELELAWYAAIASTKEHQL